MKPRKGQIMTEYQEGQQKRLDCMFLILRVGFESTYQDGSKEYPVLAAPLDELGFFVSLRYCPSLDLLINGDQDG